MLLPGGLWRDGALRRRTRLCDPDGGLELLVAEAVGRAGSLHGGVSRVLSAFVVDVEGEPLDEPSAQSLCVADRQFLMQRAAVALGLSRQWVATSCGRCEAAFELEVDVAALPVGEAGPGFPFVTVETEAGPLRLRVPTGADQAAIGELGDRARAERELLGRCVVEGELPEALSADDLARIEAALDGVSPWVVTELEGRCPECDATQAVPLDPYLAMRLPASRILDEVHTLAWHYHWSEAEILALPRERRQFYLSRVDRARGLTS